MEIKAVMALSDAIVLQALRRLMDRVPVGHPITYAQIQQEMGELEISARTMTRCMARLSRSKKIILSGGGRGFGYRYQLTE